MRPSPPAVPVKPIVVPPSVSVRRIVSASFAEPLPRASTPSPSTEIPAPSGSAAEVSVPRYVIVWLPIRILSRPDRGPRTRRRPAGGPVRSARPGQDRPASAEGTGPEPERTPHAPWKPSLLRPGRPVSASAPGSGTQHPRPPPPPHGSSQYRGCTSVDGACSGSRPRCAYRAAPASTPSVRERSFGARGDRPSAGARGPGRARTKPQPCGAFARSVVRSWPAAKPVRRPLMPYGRVLRPAARTDASTVQNVRGRVSGGPRAPPCGRPEPGPRRSGRRTPRSTASCSP